MMRPASMADYFVRADLARGELRRCYPGVVPADAIDYLVDTLDRIMLTGQATVPGRPGFTLIGGKAGQSLAVALHGPDGGLMLTIAVCLRSRDSARVWAKLHDGQGGLLTRGDSPPATPWLAERIEAGAADHMADMRWSGSLAQAVAWAWEAYQARLTAPDPNHIAAPRRTREIPLTEGWRVMVGHGLCAPR